MGLILYLPVGDDASSAHPAPLHSSDDLFVVDDSNPTDHLNRLSQIDDIAARNRAIPQARSKHNRARLWPRYRATARSHHFEDVSFVPGTEHTVNYMQEANRVNLPRRRPPCLHRQCLHPAHLWEKSCRVYTMLGKMHYDEELCGQHLDKWHAWYHGKTSGTLQFVAADTQMALAVAVRRPPRLKRQGAFRASGTAKKCLMP
ncbi:hypothetical protein SEPCBS57363_001163 [Sporothrix epigloea]|uniref:Uncharacterized protein n=1 Tax=Sporothrix epigloea TaxID=1892477 RepID=A0ABP0DB70_9PEZI